MSKETKPHPKPSRMVTYFKQWRKFRGFTQEELAEIVGVTPSSISQLETGKQGFTDTTLFALAEALSCNPGDLLMRNPLDQDAPWSLWESVKNQTPEKRLAITDVVKTMLKTGTG